MHAFKEKMAFFTNLRNDVPEVIPGNTAADNTDKSSTREEDEEEEEV